MKVKYELDKEKFVKVYNELYCGNTETVIDRFGLFCRYDRTTNKILKDIMYAITNNLDFEIQDIKTIQEIIDMYSYHEKPNKVTPQDISKAIKELNSIEPYILSEGTYINEVHLSKQNDNELILGLMVSPLYGDNMFIWTPIDSVLDKIKEAVHESNACYRTMKERHHELLRPKSLVEVIKSWFK